MSKNAIISFIVVLTVSNTVFALKEGGGGDAVQGKDGKWTLLDLAEQRELAYYIPKSEKTQLVDKLAVTMRKCGLSSLGMVEYSDMEASPFATLLGYFGDYLKLSSITTKLIDLNSSNRSLHPLVWKMTDKDLEDIKDEGVIRLEDISSKKQVAIQKNGVVIINRPIFNQFDDHAKAALLFHEITLAAVLVANPKLIENSTDSIREFVQLVFTEEFPSLPDYLALNYCGKSPDGLFLDTLNVEGVDKDLRTHLRLKSSKY